MTLYGETVKFAKIEKGRRRYQIDFIKHSHDLFCHQIALKLHFPNSSSKTAFFQLQCSLETSSNNSKGRSVKFCIKSNAAWPRNNLHSIPWNHLLQLNFVIFNTKLLFYTSVSGFESCSRCINGFTASQRTSVFLRQRRTIFSSGKTARYFFTGNV